jgi:hypothetical protein
MPSLLKKKSEKPAVALVPAWHPNFRNFERLPDTKVVRTTFFINTATIALSLGLVLWFSYQEYTIRDLSQQITYWQRQIDSNEKAANTAIARYQQFQNEEKKFADVEAFVKLRLSPAGFLLRLGRTLPPTMALDSVELHAEIAVMRGTLTGTPDEASGLAANYIDQLRADPLLGTVFDDISITTLARDPTGQRLRFEFALRVKDARKS